MGRTILNKTGTLYVMILNIKRQSMFVFQQKILHFCPIPDAWNCTALSTWPMSAKQTLHACLLIWTRTGHWSVLPRNNAGRKWSCLSSQCFRLLLTSCCHQQQCLEVYIFCVWNWYLWSGMLILRLENCGRKREGWLDQMRTQSKFSMPASLVLTIPDQIMQLRQAKYWHTKKWGEFPKCWLIDKCCKSAQAN